MPKRAPSICKSPRWGPRHMQVCQEEASVEEKTHVSGEIQLDFRLSLWLSAALDQPDFLGYVCSGGPERVMAGMSVAVLRQFVAGV